MIQFQLFVLGSWNELCQFYKSFYNTYKPYCHIYKAFCNIYKFTSGPNFCFFESFPDLSIKVAVTGVKMPAVRGDGMRGLVKIIVFFSQWR